MLKAKVKKDEFLKGLSHTSNIAGKFTSMQILTNVLLESSGNKLILNATDLEITFRASYDADVEEEGKIAIPAKTLDDIVNSLPSDVVSLEELDNKVLEIKSGSFKTNIIGQSVDDFPLPPSLAGLPMAVFDAVSLTDAINKTSYSVTSHNSNNFNLAGVYWTKEPRTDNGAVLRLVSSDSNRLNVTTLNPEDLEEFQIDAGILVPRKGILELKSLAETTDKIKIGVNINSLVAQTDNAILMIRLLEGKFPDYGKITAVPPTTTLFLNRKDFLEVLGRVTLIASSKERVMYFLLEPNSLTLRVSNQERGQAEESLSVEYLGESLEVGFDHRHLFDPLKNLNSDIFQLAFVSPDKPARITAEHDPGYVGIVTTITKK